MVPQLQVHHSLNIWLQLWYHSLFWYHHRGRHPPTKTDLFIRHPKLKIRKTNFRFFLLILVIRFVEKPRYTKSCSTCSYFSMKWLFFNALNNLHWFQIIVEIRWDKISADKIPEDKVLHRQKPILTKYHRDKVQDGNFDARSKRDAKSWTKWRKFIMYIITFNDIFV